MLRHVILTQGRSGSNFLANTLNRHPEVVNFGEVLGRWTVGDRLYRVLRCVGCSRRGYLDLLFHSRALYCGAQLWSAGAHLRKRQPVNFKRRGRVRTIGIKEFGIHFQRLGLGDYLRDNPDIAVVHLVRENLLRRYLSLESLRRRELVSVTETPVAMEKMRVDVEDVLEKLDVLREEVQYERDLVTSLRGNPVLRIRYEDAFADTRARDAMIARVFEFLGVAPKTIESDQRKILPTALEEIVENHDELVAALRGTQHARFLD